MMSYMEMIFIDGNDARHTNVRAAFETNAKTWDQFKKCRALEVTRDKATFLLDYHNSKGDLADTIFLDDNGYERISNEPVAPASHYRMVDRVYWLVARRDYETRKAA